MVATSFLPAAHLVNVLSAAIVLLFVGVLILLVFLVLMRVILARRERVAEARKERVRPLVLDILTGESEAAEAAWMLDRYTTPKDRRALDEVLIENARIVKGHEKELLTEIFEKLDFVDEDISRLESGSRLEQAEAAFHLGTMGSPRAVEPLLRALDSADQAVAFSSLDALSHIGTPEATDGVMLAISNRRDLQSSRVAEVLLERKDEFAPMVVEKLEGNVMDTELKDLLVDTAGAMHDSRASAVLESILLDAAASAETRAKAARSLGRVEDPGACSLLSTALADPSPLVRAEAAEALGRLGCADSVPGLANALADPFFEVRINASFALTKLGRSGSLALEDRLRAPLGVGREAAAEALDTAAVRRTGIRKDDVV